MTKPRLKFLLLAAIFAAPLTAAALLYFIFPEMIPSGRVNYGTLVEPARPLPELSVMDISGAPAPATALKGKWTLVYLGDGECGESCRARLVLTRQVRLALNEKRLRVQRLYLAPHLAAAAVMQRDLGEEHPDLLYLVDGDARARAFFAPKDPHALYLVDPLGNWMMFYDGQVEHKGLHKDLKKLLRFSQIG